MLRLLMFFPLCLLLSISIHSTLHHTSTMENLIIPCKSKPTIFESTSHDFTNRPIPILSPPKIAQFTPSDKHLHYLCKRGRLRDAVSVLQRMSQTGLNVRLQPETYTHLLDSCIDENSVSLGRKLHGMLGLVERVDVFLETKVVSMYAKCGCLEDARKVFDEMRERNLYSYSAMIGAYCRKKKWREVLEVFTLMMGDEVLPDAFLLPKILQACGNCEDLGTGKAIHSLVVRCGLSTNVRVCNTLMAVYAKCGKLEFARRVFDEMGERDVVSWNSLISGYCQKGQNEEALQLVDRMQDEGIEPGIVTWNLLISSYCQLANCDAALQLMRRMENVGIVPDVFTWTSLISGFSQNNRRSQALDLFREMLLVGVGVNEVTLISAISVCTSLQALSKGMEVHSVAIKMGLSDDVMVGNTLIDMYSKCGELKAARRVFDAILDKDVYSWNSMIGGYFQAGYCGKAHELFLKMQGSDVQPNVITWNAMISGFMQNDDEDQAISLFERMQRDGNVQRNTASWNSLIAGYSQNGQKDKALGIFRQMQSCIRPNSVTILSVLPSCANLVALKKVKEIHCSVLRQNLESLSVANSLIDTYTKSGKIEYSEKLFRGILVKDVITWNSMISGYVLHGNSESALDLFVQMRKMGIKPNRGTFLSIINAYGHAGKIEEANQLFSSITEDHLIVHASEHYLAMVNLYGRAGLLDKAVDFIEDMPIDPDPSIWRALLTACRIHGNKSLAMLAAEKLLEFDSIDISDQHVISQTFASCGKSEYPLKLKRLAKENIAKKTLGQSWVENGNVVHTFQSDHSSSYSETLHSWVHNIERELGAPESFHGTCIDEEKEGNGLIHSEKLAIAFALAGRTLAPQKIRIMKDSRMCAECHKIFKYVSSSYGCDIYLSDSKSFHHFKDGICSCGDYW